MTRSDGRMSAELRPTRLTPGFLLHAEGSVLIEVGRTRVICTASVEDRVPPFLRNTGKGWVTAEYGMLPRATSTRTQREATAGKVGGRTQEIQRLIGRSLRSVTRLTGARRAHDLDRLRRHPGRRRHAHGVDHRRLRRPRPRAAADARERPDQGDSRSGLRRRDERRRRRRHADARPCLRRGLTRRVDMNIVKTGDGRFIEVQGTAEGQPFERQALDDLMALGDKGISELVALQREIVGSLLPACQRRMNAPRRHDQPGQGPGDQRHPRAPGGLACRARVAARFSRHRRTGRNRRNIRRERTAQGALLLARPPGCRASPTTRAWKSTRSTMPRRPLGAVARHRLRREVPENLRAPARARRGNAARRASSATSPWRTAAASPSRRQV